MRFISDPAAQVAALLSGDVDAFPRVAAAPSLKAFRADRRFQVLVGGSRAKTILAINNKRPPLDDVRVRRAIAAAIDRQAVIDGAADGFGVPIGSFYVPGAPGYIDTTGINPYDPAKARALLHQAGITPPLELTMKLPPTPYARQGGEVVAAMLAKVGIHAKIENVEWAQWLSGVYGQKAYDLTLISHVEPLDFGNFARPNYYWNYDSAEFNALWERVQSTIDPAERKRLLAQAQTLVAHDAVAAYLYQPTWITVANARLQGLWKDMPLFVNDLAACAGSDGGVQRSPAAVEGCSGRPSRCPASAQLSMCSAPPAQRRRLSPVFGISQARRPSSGSPWALRQSMSSTPPWVTTASRMPARADASSRTAARTRSWNWRRLSPPGSAKSARCSSQRIQRSGWRALMVGTSSPSRMPKFCSRKPASATAGRSQASASGAAVSRRAAGRW